MIEILRIARKGAGVPMRVVVIRRPHAAVRRFVWRMGRGGAAHHVIAARLRRRPEQIARLMAADPWAAACRGAP